MLAQPSCGLGSSTEWEGGSQLRASIHLSVPLSRCFVTSCLFFLPSAWWKTPSNWSHNKPFLLKVALVRKSIIAIRQVTNNKKDFPGLKPLSSLSPVDTGKVKEPYCLPVSLSGLWWLAGSCDLKLSFQCLHPILCYLYSFLKHKDCTFSKLPTVCLCMYLY